MKKYFDKQNLVFGVGAIIGGVVFNMFIVDKLPATLKGGA